MKKKLTAAVVALSVILAMAVALLIYLELTQDGEQPIDTTPTSSVGGDTETPTSSEQPETKKPGADVQPEPETTEPNDAAKDEPQAPEVTESTATEPEQTDATTVPVEGSDGEFIIGPDDSTPEDTKPEKEPDNTEYTPPAGLDEDETPIL